MNRINQLELQLIGYVEEMHVCEPALFHHIVGSEFREFYFRIHNV